MLVKRLISDEADLSMPGSLVDKARKLQKSFQNVQDFTCMQNSEQRRNIGWIMLKHWLDYAEAIKLALCKAKEKHWLEPGSESATFISTIAALFEDEQSKRRLFAQLEGIQILGSLFMKCSFSLTSHQTSMTSRMILLCY